MKLMHVGVVAAVVLTVVLLAAGAVSGAGGAERRAGNGTDVPHGLAVSPDGSTAFVTGDSDGGMKTNYDFATVAYKLSTGKRIWTARFNGAASKVDGGESVQVSPDGARVYVTGATVSMRGGFDFGTFAYDAQDGRKLWASLYDGPAHGADGGEDMVVSPDGAKVFVTGSTWNGKRSYTDFATIAYDGRTGRRLWAARYDGPGHGTEEWASITVSADGTKVFVSGGSEGADEEFDYSVIAYDAATGTQLWVSRYDGMAHQEAEACSVAVSGDGSRVFASGYTRTEAGSDEAATVALDGTTGRTLWVATYSASEDDDDRTCSLHVSSDGTKVFGTGFSFKETGSGDEADTDSDYATIAFDAATGEKLWVARYDGPGHADDWPHSLGLSPDEDTVFVTGEIDPTYFSFVNDYLTVAYDAETGGQLWIARYAGPGKGNDIAGSLAVAGGTRLVVTGMSDGKATRSDYATIAYDAATGRGVWLARYNGPGVLCIVPDVRQRPLATAKTWIREEACAVGKVTHVASPETKGRVVSQKPAPRTRLPLNSRVALQVSRGSK